MRSITLHTCAPLLHKTAPRHPPQGDLGAHLEALASLPAGFLAKAICDDRRITVVMVFLLGFFVLGGEGAEWMTTRFPSGLFLVPAEACDLVITIETNAKCKGEQKLNRAADDVRCEQAARGFNGINAGALEWLRTSSTLRH